MKQFFLAVAVLLLPAFSVRAADGPLKVFVFAGQSNMVGLESRSVLLSSNLRSRQRDVLFWDGRNWKPYSPGMGQEKGFGPEASCGFELARALGEPVGMIKHSVGGSNLSQQWNPTKPGSLYAELKKKVNAAAGSRAIEVVGMFWMQGEGDAANIEMSMAYARNLDAFISRARRDFGNSKMIFVSGRVNSMTSPYLGDVRRAQEKGRRYYDWINLDRLPKLDDQVHYDTKGITEMGRLFATKFISLSRSR